MNFKVEWTGSYPCLCFGEWVVKYKEQELELPEEIASESMDTLNFPVRSIIPWV